MDVFKKMKQYVVPDVVTYNALMNACEKGKQPEQALEFFEVMQRHGVAPNMITYNALISTCGKSFQPKQALEVSQAM